MNIIFIIVAYGSIEVTKNRNYIPCKFAKRNYFVVEYIRTKK